MVPSLPRILNVYRSGVSSPDVMSNALDYELACRLMKLHQERVLELLIRVSWHVHLAVS